MATRPPSVRRSAAPKSPGPRSTAPKTSNRKSAASQTSASARGKQPSAAQAAPRPALAKPSAAKQKGSPKRAPAPRPAVPQSKPSPQPKKAAPRVSLGRPKVVGEELLDLVFKEDFHARQIFVFLGVRTVRELEDFGPQQILDKAAQPLRETVDRIRRRLALLNRSLRDDQEFAATFLEHLADETSP